MKKRAILLVGLVMAFTACRAQKFDNQWVFGYNYNSSNLEREGYRLVFDTFPPKVVLDTSADSVYLLGASASICDSSGNLQLLTNNCFISGSDGSIIEGGDVLTTGWELDHCVMYRWYPFKMYDLFLPTPGNSNSIYLFQRVVYNNLPEIYTKELVYSKIDLTENDGHGKVSFKEKKVLENKLSYGEMTAVKHGNGRDWWLPVPAEKGNKIYIILVSKDSVYVHHEQSLGPDWSNSGSFQAAFSPDGTKYVRCNGYYGVYLYDFDRCSGMLSNLIYFPLSDSIQGLTFGAAFSKDNRFLYLSNINNIYQFDINSNEIELSKEVVAKYDANINVFWTDFEYILPGPDGRLYVTTTNTTNVLHVINRPNLKGIACDVRQHDIEFPFPYGSPPNFPNFRLGALDGSPCDTLGFNNYPLADFRPEASDSNGLAWTFWDVSSYAPAHWLWDFGDGTMSNDTTAAHVFAAPGDYTVCLTVSNNYGTHTKCKIVRVMTTGVSSPGGKKAELWLYPNPTKGLLRVAGDHARAYAVRVYDLNGRLVFSGKTLAGEVDLSGLSNGAYLLQAADEDGVIRRGKVVVLR